MSDVHPPSEPLVIEARVRSIGPTSVRRLLPYMKRRMVGPFIFFDHFGPKDIAPGARGDVLPHPHIGLATVTYLFEGEMVHRDSVGSVQTIRPGAVNWMSAGRGIVHSERAPEGAEAHARRSHGIQSWVALSREAEAAEPHFQHVAASAIPELARDGVRIRVVAGHAYGERSPVEVDRPTLYVDLHMPAGSEIDLPTEHAERAIYPVLGQVSVPDAGIERRLEPGAMLVLDGTAPHRLVAHADSRVMVIGGAPFEEKRHIWWNFVASDRAAIEDAKARWRERRFPAIPGDDEEFVPLPDGA